jgi:branched-chain amino acid transport system substrate-binding protein
MEQKTKETGKRWKIGLIVILALALVLIGINFVYFTGFAIEQESKELTVGVVVPLSGDLAIIGEEMQRGVELRLDDARAEKFGIKVIYEDDQSLSAVAAVNAANKLTSIDRVDAGLTAIVEEAHPMGPIFERNEIPLLVAWDSNEWIQDSGEYTFSTGFSTEKTGAKLAGYAYNELGMRRVAIVSHIESFSQIISEAFTNEFEARGGEIVLHEEHLLDDVDYRTTISKIKALDVDGVYFPLIPPTSVHFLKQVEELDLEVQLLRTYPNSPVALHVINPQAN